MNKERQSAVSDEKANKDGKDLGDKVNLKDLKKLRISELIAWRRIWGSMVQTACASRS